MRIKSLGLQSNISRNVIEIVLGGWTNTLSCIRLGVQGEVWIGDAYTPHLLHCGEYRQFWIHWRSVQQSVRRVVGGGSKGAM